MQKIDLSLVSDDAVSKSAEMIVYYRNQSWFAKTNENQDDSFIKTEQVKAIAYGLTSLSNKNLYINNSFLYQIADKDLHLLYNVFDKLLTNKNNIFSGILLNEFLLIIEFLFHNCSDKLTKEDISDCLTELDIEPEDVIYNNDGTYNTTTKASVLNMMIVELFEESLCND